MCRNTTATTEETMKLKIDGVIKFAYFKIRNSVVPQEVLNKLSLAGIKLESSDIVDALFPSNPNNCGYVVIAMNRPENNDLAQMHHAGFCYCSPKDHFSKKIGRQIAEGRLRKGGDGVVSFKYRGKIVGAFEKALLTSMQNKQVPNWVKKGHVQYGLSDIKAKLHQDMPNAFAIGEPLLSKTA